jgi:hypothetical protein
VSWAVVVALCWVGWALAAAGAVVLRRRTTLVADAEHELRGAVTAIGLAADASPLVQLQLDRMTVALADLARARGGPRPAPTELAAGRLAQVLANVSANAAEHGLGPVLVRSERDGGVVRLAVSNAEPAAAAAPGRPARGRGRGLRIAKRAARELGGRVALERVDGEFRTVIELPIADTGNGDGSGPAGQRPGADSGRGGEKDGRGPDRGDRRRAA